MLKPNYAWWGYVKYMIWMYPHRKDQTLYGIEAEEYTAVGKAIEQTSKKKDGKIRLNVIDLVMWQHTHTIAGAAVQVFCSERTAQNWCTEFIETVARNFRCDGLIS